jgi:hypothetical protein
MDFSNLLQSLDWTSIIVFVFGLVVSICLSLLSKQVIPWLKAKNLFEAAQVAVDAAEAIYGRYNGETKLKAALESMAARGYDVNSDAVINAVQAAWKNLDSVMHMSGEKEIEGNNG